MKKETQNTDDSNNKTTVKQPALSSSESWLKNKTRKYTLQDLHHKTSTKHKTTTKNESNNKWWINNKITALERTATVSTGGRGFEYVFIGRLFDNEFAVVKDILFTSHRGFLTWWDKENGSYLTDSQMPMNFLIQSPFCQDCQARCSTYGQRSPCSLQNTWTI